MNFTIKEVLDLLRSSIPTSIEIISEQVPDNPDIYINPVQFHQVVMNLCINAYHAMGENGILQVAARTISGDPDLQEKFPHLKEGKYLELTVKDTGKGMDPETLNRIFEPYFTTKQMESGTGLGLSTVHGIIHEAGGAIDVESTPGQGSVFTVYLPIFQPHYESNMAEGSAKIFTGNEHILIVDDEPPIVELSGKHLTRCGYKVTTFHTSADALMAVKNHPTEFDLVITDNSMPNMTGTQLAGEIRKINPNLPVILATGFKSKTVKQNISATGIKAVIMKPFSKEKISNTVHKVLNGE